jgi:nucleotide-binding universal stress UspA family protein
MKRILLPVDGSPGCQQALTIAEDIAKKFDSTIVAFCVFDLYRIPNELEYAGYIEKMYDTDGKKEFLDKTVKYFEDRGIKAEAKLIKGDPPSDIIDEADNGEYDLVIMCSRGMSASKRFLLGSVTSKVVHHVKTPILVVK